MTVVNIDGIKTQIKSILDTANTTTAATDLSNGMSSRVQRVMKIHPNRIPIQPSFFPFVTMYVSDKSVEQITLGTAGNQASALREGIFTIDIFGAVYEPFYSDFDEDQGSENVEILMENIEEIIRANPDINSTVAWNMPTSVQYDEIPWDEEAHLRAGILTLECKVHY